MRLSGDDPLDVRPRGAINDQLVQGLAGAYDAVVKDLALEDAIEVAEGLSSYVETALVGLRQDRAHVDAVETGDLDPDLT